MPPVNITATPPAFCPQIAPKPNYLLRKSENDSSRKSLTCGYSCLARATGLEPATTGSTVRYSNQLSYAPNRWPIPRPASPQYRPPRARPARALAPSSKPTPAIRAKSSTSATSCRPCSTTLPSTNTRPSSARPSSAAGRQGRRRMSNQGKLSNEKKEIRRRFQSGGISSRARLRHESSAGREKIRGGSIYLLGNPRMTPILSAENANTLASETRRYFGL